MKRVRWVLLILIGVNIILRLMWIEFQGYTLESDVAPILLPGYQLTAFVEIDQEAQQAAVVKYVVQRSPGFKGWITRARYALLWSWLQHTPAGRDLRPRIEVMP